MEFLTKFPEMGRTDLRDFKKGIDAAFRDFSREFGESIEDFFDPLLWFLSWLQKLLVSTPLQRETCVPPLLYLPVLGP